MSGRVLQIQRKTRDRPHAIVSPQDFEWTEAEAIEASSVLNHPNASLYCLDLKTQRFIFVETPASQDLSAAPVYYQAQYEAAQRLFAVPFKDFYPLAATLAQSIAQQLVFIYGVEGCGSTILSQIFHQVTGVFSLSEPDVFSQLVAIRNRDRARDPEVAQLLKLCIALVCKAAPQIQSTCCVIKFRSYGIELADLLHLVFPKAKAMFLYSDAKAAVQSSTQANPNWAKRRHSIQRSIDSFNLLIPLLKEYAERIDFNDPNATDLYTIMWLSVVDRYIQLHQQRIPMIVLRYSDLVEQPELTIEAIFHYCRLNTDAAETSQLLSRDLQRSGNPSQANPQNRVKLNDAELDQKIRRLLSYHPIIQSADFMPPVGY